MAEGSPERSINSARKRPFDDNLLRAFQNVKTFLYIRNTP